MGSLALMGFPFLAGFYSKDLIIELVFSSFRVDALIVAWLAILGAFFTAFYSFKIIYLTFLQFPSSYRFYLDYCHDAPLIMYIPLILLSFLSIKLAFFLKKEELEICAGSFSKGIFWKLFFWQLFSSLFSPNPSSMRPKTSVFQVKIRLPTNWLVVKLRVLAKKLGIPKPEAT